MQLRKSREVDSGISLRLTGHVGPRDLDRLRQRLREAVDAYTSVTVDCGGADRVGVGVLQVLISAKRTATRGGKVLRVDAGAGSSFRAALDRAGLHAEFSED